MTRNCWLEKSSQFLFEKFNRVTRRCDSAMPFGFIVQKRTPFLFAGRLRHRVDIVSISPTQDSTGGQNLSVDTIYANIWASIEALNGTEKFAAHEFVSQATHQIVLRYLDGINSGQQVWFEGRQFQIEAVLNPDERNKMLILICIEINDSLQQNPNQPGDLD